MRLQFLRNLCRRPRLQRWMQRAFQSRADTPPAPLAPGLRVLVAGVYLGDRENSIGHLVRRFAEAGALQVEQRWACLGTPSDDSAVRAVTTVHEPGRAPKFELLNRLLRPVDPRAFDHIVFCDDDIFVRRGFLDRYIALVHEFGFSIAQPARAWHSHFDHEFVLAKPWLVARETRFVEIGPVFSFDRAAAALLLPFDETSPMGWGYDYHWPALLAQHGLKMGVVDASRVDHSIRPQAAAYQKPEEAARMAQYFATHAHIGRDEAQVRLKDHLLARGEHPLRRPARRLLAAWLDHDTRLPSRDGPA